MSATTLSDKFLNAVARWSGQVGAAGVSSTSATVIPLQSSTGLVNGRVYWFTLNRLTGTTKNAVSNTEGFPGIINTTTHEITTTAPLRGSEGTATAWPAGTLVEILHSAGYMNRFIEGLEVSLNQDGSVKSAVVDGTKVYAADAGSTDAYAITLSPAPSAYATGQTFRFKANTVNTGTATLNVNTLGAKTIKKNYNSDLADGDILANQLVEVIYDGTNFQLLSPISNAGDVTQTGTQTLSNKTLTSPVLQGNVDGWILANESWTYNASNAINVPSGAASKYAKGDKIKLTQTTVKYFYVVGVADTVLTVTGGSDYTVANAAISANCYSHQESPIGFPIVFNYTPTGPTNTTLTGKFSIAKGYVTCQIYGAVTGTPAFTNLPTLPVAASATAISYAIGAGWFDDYGTAQKGNLLTPIVYPNGTSLMYFLAATAAVSATVPITWASNDSWGISIVYQF